MPADPAEPPSHRATTLAARVQAALERRTAHLTPTARALLWSTAAGLQFSMLNAVARTLTLQLPPLESQFLRYLCGGLLMVPLVWRAGWTAWRPASVRGQFIRGSVHAFGLVLWFSALPQVPLADMTAIGFTGPLFILIGAWLFLREPMRWERWLATGIGFAGVLIVLGPRLTGSGGLWHLVMFASAPMFAASFLLTKALTRTDSPGVIVLWQAITVSLLSLPLALPGWVWPNAAQWLGFFFCGALGSSGHYCLTRSYASADISATQSTRFLDLIWSSLLGLAIFADVPTVSTLIGGLVIAAATLWLAAREGRR